MKTRTVALGVAVLVVVIGIAGVFAFQSLGFQRSGLSYQGTLTAPSGGKPFGGSAVGTYSAQVSGHTVTVTASVSQSPQAGTVFEGWLVDPASGYKLSIGQLDGTSLHFTQSMVNPAIYKLLVVTIEPIGKTNPNPSGVILGGTQLPQSFGM